MGESPDFPVAVTRMADRPVPGVPGPSVSRWAVRLDDVGGLDCEVFGMGDRRSGLSRGLDH